HSPTLLPRQPLAYPSRASASQASHLSFPGSGFRLNVTPLSIHQSVSGHFSFQAALEDHPPRTSSVRKFAPRLARRLSYRRQPQQDRNLPSAIYFRRRPFPAPYTGHAPAVSL